MLNKTVGKTPRKNDIKLLCLLIGVFIFIVWLCTPPGNKFAQMCLWGNNTKFVIAKLTQSSDDINEWKFYRNNAVYLADMGMKKKSISEFKKALATVPTYISDSELQNLYSDGARLFLFFKEYKNALGLLVKIEKPDIKDMFKIALLYKEIGNLKKAVSYCNSIINMDNNAYIGYVCLADMYATAKKYNTSVKIYDLLILNKGNRANYYSERAQFKRLAGDIKGCNEDLAKARNLYWYKDEYPPIINETLNPARLEVSIIK